MNKYSSLIFKELIDNSFVSTHINQHPLFQKFPNLLFLENEKLYFLFHIQFHRHLARFNNFARRIFFDCSTYAPRIDKLGDPVNLSSELLAVT